LEDKIIEQCLTAGVSSSIIFVKFRWKVENFVPKINQDIGRLCKCVLAHFAEPQDFVFIADGAPASLSDFGGPSERSLLIFFIRGLSDKKCPSIFYKLLFLLMSFVQSYLTNFSSFDAFVRCFTHFKYFLIMMTTVKALAPFQEVKQRGARSVYGWVTAGTAFRCNFNTSVCNP
jgi:hypothetical protein